MAVLTQASPSFGASVPHDPAACPRPAPCGERANAVAQPINDGVRLRRGLSHRAPVYTVTIAAPDAAPLGVRRRCVCRRPWLHRLLAATEADTESEERVVSGNERCAMNGCRKKNTTLLFMGQSNRGLGGISLVICAEENHKAELADFHRRHIRPSPSEPAPKASTKL